MRQPDAVRCVAMLAAYFPSRPLSQETAALWANAIVDNEVEDAFEAVLVLGTMGRFLPSLMEFTETIRDCRNKRLTAEYVALPEPDLPRYPFAQFLAEHPDMAERVKALEGGPQNPIVAALAQLLRDQ